MCGICGIVSLSGGLAPSGERRVDAMLERMRHRGPDHRSRTRIGERAVLGGNRLAITDPGNEAANMPFSSADGVVTAVYNGEIYNFRELRAELSDYPFRTRCDTEVLVAAYLRWGEGFLDRLEGMYAFCLHDRRTGGFLLAVDPSGQKPLYYMLAGDSFYFASEIEALIFDSGEPLEWSKHAIAEMICARFAVGRDTHVEQIKRLRDGCLLRVGDGLSERRYYHVPIGDQSISDPIVIGTALRGAVHDACLSTFDLEVPYGMLVSGGIDSAVVLSRAAHAGLDLRTYSIGFAPFEGPSVTSDTIWDEFEHSRAVTAGFGAGRHSEILLDAADYFRYLDRWCEVAGEPLGSQEAPCLLKLFEEVGKDCRVAFCGSAPDEVFDGYGNGRALALQGCAPSEVARRYFESFLWVGDVDLDRLLCVPGARERAISKIDGFIEPYREKVDDVLQLVQLVNFHGRCVVYEYRQMDKISMSRSVEVRTPLADRRVTKEAFAFDPALKNRDGEEKWIWKDAMAPFAGAAIAARKKAAFPIPSQLWFSKPFEERVEGTLFGGSALASSGVADMDYLRSIWDSRLPGYRNIFYRLLVIASVMDRQRAFVGGR